MPCFLSGVAAAESISATLGAPLYRFSHQCGHVMAALYSSGAMETLEGKEFVAFHVSGGTTEVLYVTPTADAYRVECIGGTLDLNAGQAVDRVGESADVRGADLVDGAALKVRESAVDASLLKE